MRLDLRRYPGAIISNLYQHAVQFPRSPQPNLAFTLHGFDRVVDKVGPDLIEFAAVGADSWQALVVLAHDGDPGLEPVTENRQSAFKSLVEIDLLHGGAIHVRIFFDGPHQLRNAASAVLDLGD